MKFDFEKLTVDVTAAMEAGKRAADAVDDGGTCNLDGVILKIPKANEAAVVDALRKAGVRVLKSKWGIYGVGYMINPPWGQADKRTRAVDAIYEHLFDAGYEVVTFYLTD